MSVHQVKEHVILAHAQRYGCLSLVETGTLYGEMILALRNKFLSIYSVELKDEFAKRAQDIFSQDKHIHIYSGNSPIILGQIMTKLESAAVFWLDAHYSGGATALGPEPCPILGELETIFNAPDMGHVILIDDSVLFGLYGWPPLDIVIEFIHQKRPGLKVDILPEGIVAATPGELGIFNLQGLEKMKGMQI